jgi:hypothetical protein
MKLFVKQYVKERASKLQKNSKKGRMKSSVCGRRKRGLYGSPEGEHSKFFANINPNSDTFENQAKY